MFCALAGADRAKFEYHEGVLRAGSFSFHLVHVLDIAEAIGENNKSQQFIQVNRSDALAACCYLSSSWRGNLLLHLLFVVFLQ